MTYLLGFFLMCHAGVDDLLSAHEPSQILALHKNEEEVAILKQRCEVEVRGGLFPQ